MQPTLLVFNQVAVRYILMRSLLNEPIRNYSKENPKLHSTCPQGHFMEIFVF